MLILNCAGMDRLLERARAGDPTAWSAILRILPRDLPAAERQRERNERLRELAQRVHAQFPASSRHAIASFLRRAGAHLEAGRALAGRPFDALSTAELAQLQADIEDLLTWLPARRNGGRWPQLRQILAILE